MKKVLAITATTTDLGIGLNGKLVLYYLLFAIVQVENKKG